MEPKKRLLYLGNKLAVHGKPPTTIDSLSVKLEEEGCSVISGSSKLNKIARLFDMTRLTIKNRNKVDLVLIDTYSTTNFYYALLVAGLCKVFALAYIPILHGGNLSKRLKNNPRLSKFLFGGSHTNVAPSKYMLKQFQQEGFQNLTYIPNSLAIENYPFKSREVVEPKLLWVRSFSEIYNPLLALEIVERLLKRGISVSLCMVGPDKDGTMERCKKVASELNLPVTFTGLMQKAEWIELSKDYDVFINTTNFDNMPVSVMEAMALGMPVVSTNVGGVPFLIANGEHGVLVPPNNAEAFVNAIIELSENPLEANRISQKARFKVDKYDWDNVKKKWIKLLQG
ncbi:glycosyltransferase family 4 protein [Aequorivita marina]|uniref:glycosyltransferase family 4 protein n=1 Tax=Aequorivita marina TaxID=3073654 RepID=UPI002876BFD3|nr:glycosyltransferase family 4 protein [Aequorivita sp. S2608]MDS1298028.1 glycosyltransferase family 4 protein [Aequorivita sp. S2608]